MRRTTTKGPYRAELQQVIAMNDGWLRPSASEDFGDAFIVSGSLGLIAGTALGNPSIGVICGLIAGAIADGFIVARAARAKATLR